MRLLVGLLTIGVVASIDSAHAAIWLETNEGLGAYDYIEKDATTYIHYGVDWNNWNRTQADVGFGASFYASYPGTYVHDDGGNKHLNTGDLNSGSHGAGWVAGGSLHAYIKIDNNPNDPWNQEAGYADEWMIFDVIKTDVSGSISDAPKQLVLQFKIDVGSNAGRELTRLWVSNSGTLTEDADINEVKLYYENGTTLSFDGNESSVSLNGNSGSGSDKVWGSDSLNISVPTGSDDLCVYIVIESWRSSLTLSRTAQFQITNDGMSFDQYGTSGMQLARIDATQNANALTVSDDDTTAPSLVVDSGTDNGTQGPLRIALNGVDAYSSGDTTNRVFTLTDGDLKAISGSNKLRFDFAAWDASGLARNASGSASTDMNYDIGTAAVGGLQDIYATYVSGSSAAATNDATAKWSVFEHTGPFTTTEVDYLYTNSSVQATRGLNTIRVSVPDADADGGRSGDASWLTDSQAGYLQINDDDTTGPVASNATGDGVTLSGASYLDTDLSSGLPVTVSVQDSESGVDASAATYALERNGIQVASGSFSVNFSSGGAKASAGTLSVTIGAGNVQTIGNYTLYVTNLNYDVDRTGDQEASATSFAFSVYSQTPTIELAGGPLSFSNTLVSAITDEQSYTVAAANLTNDITVTAPSQFEVSSTSGSGFASSISLSTNGGTVYVRFVPTADGAASGNISHASAGASTANMAVSGTGIGLPLARTNATANTTTAYVGDTVQLNVDAYQTWKSNNRSYARVFGRWDNADLTTGTVEGEGRDPGFAADLVYANTPKLTNSGTFYWAMRISYQSGNDFWYDYQRNDWADLAIAPPTVSTQAITVTALSAPTLGSIAVDTTYPATRLDVSWTKWNNRNVLVTIATDTPSGTPVNGTSYASAATFGNQTVVAGSSAAEALEITGLLPGTTYYVSVYSENHGYYSAAATFTATATEMPRARNSDGNANPNQPSGLFLGDTLQTFGFESWATLESNYGQNFLWLRHSNDDVQDGTRYSGVGFTNVNPKTATSGTFDQTGTWYWGMQMDYGAPYGSNFWYLSSSTTWQEMSAAGLDSALSLTVSALNDPASPTASAASASQVDLTWSQNAQSHDVMVVRKTSAQSWTEPAQGTGYAQGASLGDGVVVYNGSATSFAATNLSPVTTYDFKFYSVNNDYYSSGVTAQETTPKANQSGVGGTLSSTNLFAGGSITVTANGGASSGSYEFRQNGGTGVALFTGSGSNRTITSSSYGTAIIEVRKLGDSSYNDSDWVVVGTVNMVSSYINDWEATSNVTTFTTANLTVNGITWGLVNAMATDNDAADVKNGTRSARLSSGGSVTMLTPKRGGVSNVTFKVAQFTSGNSPSVKADYSTDGVNWTTFYSATINQSTFTTVSSNLLLTGDVYLRFVVTSGNNRFLNLDDIELTDFSPEIAVLGTNGAVIAKGSTTPSFAAGTDFGTVTAGGDFAVTNLFSITNSGAAALIISSVSTSSAMGAAADFSVLSWPTRVEAGSSSNLVIAFNPSLGGVRTAVVSIANSDYTKSNYTFVVQGTGTESEIAVSGNDVDIASGSTTISTANHTDFGTAEAGVATVTRTFTVTNSGTDNLTIDSITLSGDHAADFSVSSAASSPVASGGSTTFDILFDPSAAGVRTALVSIANNDGDENPFTFVVGGTGEAPEVDVYGNGVIIADGSTTPDLANHTDFGGVDYISGSISRTYTITNSGNLTLTVSNVVISGTHAADYTVTSQPSSTVSAGSTTTFTVLFDPSAVGVRSATLTFGHNDPDENPYNFAIQGTGTATPEIGLLGTNGAAIASGTATTSAADGTDFGTLSTEASTRDHVFVVTNAGSAAVTISGVTTSGSHAADFVILDFPATVSPFTASNLTVRFDPSAAGTRSAVITIANNDDDEGTYTFAVGGTGQSTATVFTASASGITTYTAETGGDVTFDGGATVTNRGVVYNTSGDPTLADSVVATNGGGTGSFSTSLSGLIPGATYYYRAFAQNEIGTSYGASSNFTANCFTSVVEGLVASATNFYDFTASWSALAGAQSYRIDVSTSSTFGVLAPIVTNMVTFNFPGTSIDATSASIALTVTPMTVTSGTIDAGQTAGTYFPLEPYISSSGGWGQTTPSAAKAFEVTIYPRNGNAITITSLYLHAYADRLGPSAMTIDIGSGSYVHTANMPDRTLVTFELAVTNVVNRNEPFTVRMAGWDNASRNVDGSSFLAIDTLVLDGSYTPPLNFAAGYSNRLVSGGSSVSVTGLNHTTPYFFRVKAAGGGDCFSGYSSTQTVATLTPPTNPVMGSVSFSSVGQNSATLGGTILSEERATIQSRGTVWGLSPDPTGNALTEGGTTTGSFSHARTGIPSGSLIYFRAWASNSVGISYSTNASFWTLSAAPVVGSGQSIQSTNFVADWSASIGATNYLVDVSTSSSFATFLSGYENASSGGGPSLAVTGLTRVTTYYYRVRAQNPSGLSGYSATATITTLPDLPVMTTRPASNILINTAVGGGNITDDGGGTVSTRGFVWAQTQNPTITNGGVVYAGSGTGVFSGTMTGLLANTFYYYRSFASNGAGIAYGDNRNFTTLCFTSAPVALAAGPVGGARFTANWEALDGADTYYLDASTNATFGGPGIVSGPKARFEFPSEDTLIPLMPNSSVVTASVMSISADSLVSVQSGIAAFTNAPYVQSLNGWNQANEASAKYIEFTLYPATNQYFALTNISMSAMADSKGPGLLAIQIDNQVISTNTLTADTLANISVPISGYTNVTTSVVIRIKGWSGANPGNGYLALDDVQVSGYNGVPQDFLPGFSNLLVSGTSAIVTGLQVSSTYYYRIKAANTNGCDTQYSDTITQTTAGPPEMNGFAITGGAPGGALYDSEVLSGSYSITGMVQEAVVGVAVSNEYAPYHLVYNPSGELVATTNFFETLFPGGTKTPVGVSVTGASGTYENITLGTYTTKVFAGADCSFCETTTPTSQTNLTFTVVDDDTTAPTVGEFALASTNAYTYYLDDLGVAYTGSVTDASGFGSGYFYLKDFEGTIVQSNLLYSGGGNSVTGTMTAANLICDSVYTVTVVVVDGDNDRPSDGTSATNIMTGTISTVGTGGGEDYFPTATNVTINGTVLVDNTSQTLTDANIADGGWSAGIWLSHPDLLYTNADTPSISIRNNSGDFFINNMKLTNITYEAGGLTYKMTNNNLPAASFDQVELGTYALTWSASNISACIAVVWNRGVIDGGTNVFNVVDDDTTGPVFSSFGIPGGIQTVDVSTALSGFAVTGLVQDAASGVAFTSAPPYMLLLDTDGSVLSSNIYLAGTQGAGQGSAASVTGWLSGAVLSCGNIYTVRVVAADADHDRADDESLTTSNVFSFIARGPGGTPPTASNLRINGTASGSASVTDAELAAGGWSVAVTLNHGSQAINTATVPPTFTILNTAGNEPITSGPFSWNSNGGGTTAITFTNSSLGTATYADITTGLYSFVWSAETEGVCYGLVSNSTTVSPGTNTFLVVDDDPDGPAFTGLRAGPANPPALCADATRTNLSAGDIAIIAMNMTSPADGFAFVATVDIPSGTQIKFTDHGWRSSFARFNTKEGILTWQATNCIGAGTVIRWQAGATPAFSHGALTASSGTFAFDANGDQILAYQGSDNAPEFIYALQNANAGGVWDVDSVSPYTSALPPGLLNGFSANAVVRYDHVAVSTSVTAIISGDRIAVLNHVGNKNNWSGSTVSGYDLDNLAYTYPGLVAALFSITDEVLSSGGWVITGLVQDAVSGITTNGDDTLRYRVENSIGTAVLFSNTFNVGFAQGSTAQQAFGVTLGAADFASVRSGMTTVTVFGADIDNDRPNDSATSAATVLLDVRDDDGDPPQIGYFFINGKTTIEDPLELSSAVISGQVRDVISGIAFATAPPSYTVLDGSGTTVASGAFANLPAQDGGATNWYNISTGPLNLVGIADCGTYTVRVTVADADYDHPADRLQTNLFFVLNVAATGGQAPTASDFLVDGTESGSATITDEALLNGTWGTALTVQHPEGLYTEAPYLPFFMVHNAADTMVLQGDWESISQVNDTLYLTNVVQATVDYHDIDLGSYSMMWFARNLGACFAQTGFFHTVTGGTNIFTVVDDDTTGPTTPSNITWTASAWTNQPVVSITWSSNSVYDSDGISGFRIMTNGVAPSSASSGLDLGSETTLYFTNAVEGITTGLLFAVDNDNDRPNDFTHGATTAILFRMDFTAPPAVQQIDAFDSYDSAPEIDNPVSQVSIRWLNGSASEAIAAGAPSGETLSPFQTYRIYYASNPGNNPTLTTNDLFVDVDDGYSSLTNYASTNVVLTGLIPGTEYAFAIAGVDAAGNVGSLAQASTTARTQMFDITNSYVTADNQVVIEWDGPSGVSYDVIYADNRGFNNQVNGSWRLAGTVTSNRFYDHGDASASRSAPIELAEGINRFYRVAPVNGWVPSAGRNGVASSNVVAVSRISLQAGHNIVGVGVEPFDMSIKGLLGVNRLPSSSDTVSAEQNTTIYLMGNSVDFSTASNWYNLVAGTGGEPNAWYYTSNGTDFVAANDVTLSFTNAISVDVPVATNLLLVGRPRAMIPPGQLAKTVNTNEYVTFNLTYPTPIKVKDVPDLRQKAQAYNNQVRADRLIIIDNTVNPPRAKYVLYKNSIDNKFYYIGGGVAENHELMPGEAVVYKSYPVTVAGNPRSPFTLDLAPSAEALAQIPTMDTAITNALTARPTISRIDARIDANAVNLSGRLNPNGLATTYSFVYGLTTDYGSSTTAQVLPATNNSVEVSAVLNSLAAGSRYYYALIASNSAGVATSDSSFQYGCPSITFLNESLPPMTNGAPYYVTLEASGGSTPYIYDLAAGSLGSGGQTNGLSLSTNGVISGTGVNTDKTFTVRVTDNNGCTGTRQYTIQAF